MTDAATLQAPNVSTGLASLCFAAAFFHIRGEPRQLSHSLGLGGGRAGPTELLLAAKFLNLRARLTTSTWARLERLSIPAIAELRSGEFVVVVRIQGTTAIVFDPAQPQQPRVLSQSEFEQDWTKRVLLVRNTIETTDGTRKFGLWWFAPAISKYRGILGEVFAAAFVVQLFGLATPLFSQAIIDKVLMHKSLPTLYVLGVGMLLVMLFEAVLSMLQTHLMSHTANRMDVILGSRVVSHLLRLPLRYFQLRRVGDTVAHIRELENIRQFITGSSIGSILDLFFIVVFLAVMFLYSPTLTYVVLTTLPVFVGISLAIRPLMRRRLQEKFKRGAESQSYLVEAVSGIHTVKAMALEPMMHRRWDAVLARYVTASFSATQLSSIASALSQLVQRFSTLLILWVGAELVMRGEITVGQLIAFQMLSARVIQPVVRIVQLWQDFQQVALSVDRLGDVMDSPPEPIVDPSKSNPLHVRGDLVFDNVTFRYVDAGPPVLNGLSFAATAGSTVAIVGRSGCGKSTLAKLLQRLDLPQSGRITIDDIEMQHADPSWLRRQIGVVLQENFLFSGSIRDNIAISAPTAPMESVIDVARLAGAHEFISQLPNGYDTQVGERGTSLSGGQRQRIAIARALISDPRILIFDEATSALDYESERLVQNNFHRICAGRTVFIIAHRLSTVRNADTILVMDKGTVVEQGSHAELMRHCGLYHHLFSQQEPTIHAKQVA